MIWFHIVALCPVKSLWHLCDKVPVWTFVYVQRWVLGFNGLFVTVTRTRASVYFYMFIFICFYIFYIVYLCFTQTIKATSPLGDPRVTYNLADGMVPETNMPVRFYLTPNREDGSASILVAEPLDYETTRNFMLRVRAQNVAAVPLAAFTTVYVNVTGEPL